MKNKSANGAGTIRHRPDGRWEARYTCGFNPGTGEPIRKSIYGKTQKEVRQKLTEITTEIDNGSYFEPAKMSLSEWLETWLKEYTINDTPNTLRAYQDRIRLHVLPALGAIKLSALSAPMIQSFVNSLSKEHNGKPALSAKTIKNVHGVLHKALGQAVILGYIRVNPADRCTLPKPVKKDIKPLDAELAAKFLEEAAKDKYYNIFLVDLFTGLRFGEILGLKWEDIDWKTNTISIKRQLQREKKANAVYYLAPPKSSKKRQITVAPSVMAALRNRKREQALEKLAIGKEWNETFPGLVFTTETGHCLSDTTVRKHFKSIVERIGLPDARFHDMRHSYATASLSNGDNVKTVQENLGHYSASFTLDVYGHVTDSMREQSADRMEEYIKRITG